MKRIALMLVVFVFQSSLLSAGAGQSSGTTLLLPSGAGPSGLAEAYSAGMDDICAFKYNPGTLGYLNRGHASFFYQRGLADDSNGEFAIGAPLKNKVSMGFSLSYFDAGDFLFNDGFQEKIMKAQSDKVFALGFARRFRRASWGLTGKYLTSELAQYKANTLAMDLGFLRPLGDRFYLAGALQNFGNSLKYVKEQERLPKMARLGASWLVHKGIPTTSLYWDFPYRLNEKDLRAAVGLELKMGVLAIRSGYASGKNLQKVSLGAGLILDRFSFDYAVGLADKVDTRHLASLAMRFGEPRGALQSPSKPQEEEKWMPAPQDSLKVPQKQGNLKGTIHRKSNARDVKIIDTQSLNNDSVGSKGQKMSLKKRGRRTTPAVQK